MVMVLSKRFLIGATVVLATVASAAAQEATQARVSPLPGGASSIVETFEDWRVTCGANGDKSVCTISQTQNQQNGQRVLEIGVGPGEGEGTVKGALSLPFGLALDKGVTLQIGDGNPGEPIAFSTCLPGGCIIPLNFDEATVAQLRSAQTIKLGAVTVQEQATQFAVSLKGFSAALDRAAAIAN
jgi:invasion protein IalB